MNSNKENIYCDESGNIFNSLNNFSERLPVPTSHYYPNYPFLHFKNYRTM